MPGRRTLGEARHRLTGVIFLWQFFSDGLEGDFELISRLRLRLEFMYFSSMARQW